MEKIGGTRQYLVIDLASEHWEVQHIPDKVYKDYIGGEALGFYLWSLHTQNDLLDDFALPLVFSAGALVGSKTPCSNMISIVGKSPETHLVHAATAPAEFAAALIESSWQAIVLIGVARRQMTIHIDAENVLFSPSDKLINKHTSQTAASFQTNPNVSVMSIGPAGEQKIPFSAIIHERRAMERFGFGAVLGGKHIKALAISAGEFNFRPFDVQTFTQKLKELEHTLNSSSYAQRYKQTGPLFVLEQAHRHGFAAVENSKKRTDPRLFHLESSECSRKFALEPIACENCALCCQRNVMRPGGNDAILPHALEMMALGSNIGNYDTNLVIQWRSQCIELGLHPVSTGMIIGGEMDRKNQSLEFGSSHGVSEYIEMLAKTGSPTSPDCIVGGRTMAPFDPRGAWGEALLIGLFEDFPSIPEVYFNWLPPAHTIAKAQWAVLQENLLAIFRSIGLCDETIIPLLFEHGNRKLHRLLLKFYARFPKRMVQLIQLRPLAELLSAYTGISFNSKQLMNIGRRSIALKIKLHGESVIPAPLPERFLIDPESNHQLSATVPYKYLADRYRFFRRLDVATHKED